MDDDNSYLDEASSAPAIPEGVPGDRTANRVYMLKEPQIPKSLYIYTVFSGI